MSGFRYLSADAVFQRYDPLCFLCCNITVSVTVEKFSTFDGGPIPPLAKSLTISKELYCWEILMSFKGSRKFSRPTECLGYVMLTCLCDFVSTFCCTVVLLTQNAVVLSGAEKIAF